MKKMMMISVSVAIAASAWARFTYEHHIYDAVDLNGAWEMAYKPYERISEETPLFKGVLVTNAIPGYWEDMVDAFRAAGMKDEFRINPIYQAQHFPINGWAPDTTLPNIYGCFFYRRWVNLERAGAAVLSFEGVRNQVHLWVNGEYVAFRAGFSTPFELKIPAGILRKGANEFILAVSNNGNLGYGGALVCGLTTRSIFASTGGVNGNLSLHFPKNELADVYVTTAQDLASFTIHTAGNVPFAYKIHDAQGTLKSQGQARGDITLSTAGYNFWSPESPTRYTLTLTTAEGTYTQKFGIRRLVAHGEKLFLNEKPIYLRGVTEHCYFAKTIHVPRDLDYYRMITAKRKELGFNFVRFHTFIPPAEYFEATDELGMLVHVETPNFVTEPEFAAIIAFARRHPSVVIYCTGNETRIDRLAETYLEDVANLVHARTDSLFSPMSALRGVEYAFVSGKDVIVPVQGGFKVNPERAARMFPYVDLFTSYQQGATSYDSMGTYTSQDLDRWGACYGGKPRLSHEICIDGSYVDLGLEKLYPPNSPMLKVGIFSGIRENLKKRGLLDRADTYFRNSCEWMWRVRKFTFEKLRAADRTAGYDFLGDINTHWHTFGYSVGMMDEFYRLKPGETVENVLRYNSAAVILADLEGHFNVYAGAKKRVTLSLSNYQDDAREGTIRLELRAAAHDSAAAAQMPIWQQSFPIRHVPNGKLSSLATFEIPVPNCDTAKAYNLVATFTSPTVKSENVWELHAFPRTSPQAEKPASDLIWVKSISREALLKAMADGKRVVLLGTGPFKASATRFRIGMAGRCSGDFATVIQKNHPLFRAFPNPGFCDWAFREMIDDGRAVQLEAGIPFNPVVEVATAVKYPIREAAVCEYRVGKGRFIVSAFNHASGNPAAEWFLKCLKNYAQSRDFNPALELTPAQLAAVIDAPHLSGAKNTNRARNAGDPSSKARADEFAQP